MSEDKWLDGNIIEYKEGACDTCGWRSAVEGEQLSDGLENESDHAYRAAIRTAVEAMRRAELAP